jgi:lipopolysaccharide biosynthesis glycosyltransferase
VTLPPADSTTAAALVFAADDAYAMPLGVTLHSALTHLDSSCRPGIYVVDGGISDASRSRILKLVRAVRKDASVTWLPVPREPLAGLPSGPDRTARASQAAYSRLLIPGLLPAQTRRAVYLDTDILVRGDISPLFDLDLGGAAVGATRDFLIHSTDDEMSGVRGQRAGQPYFNAGVMVIDVERWIRAQITERTLAVARSNSDQIWLDQDALNAVINDWHDLGPDWNLQVGAFRAWAFPASAVALQGRYANPASLYRAAAVIHFSGGNPWDPRCNSPGTSAWVRQLLRLRWYSPAQSISWTLHWLRLRLAFGLAAKARRLRRWLKRVR